MVLRLFTSAVLRPFIHKQTEQKPIILLLKKKIDHSCLQLAQRITEHIKVEFVDEDRKSLMIRTLKKNEKFSVFCAEMTYYRSWDIKLRKNGLVMRSANKCLVSYIKLIQMFGNGCRSMGVSQGVIFTSSPTR